MEDSDTDTDGHVVMTVGVDSFRDLLKGDIDIIEYLNSAPGSVHGGAAGGSSENIFDDDSRSALFTKMELNGLLNGTNIGQTNGDQQQHPMMHSQMHHHQQQQQLQNGNQSTAHLPPPPPRLHHHPQQHLQQQPSSTPMLHPRGAGHNPATAVYGQQHQRNAQDRPPSYDQHIVRLPDSPPETDSGAGSAGSPSGSEASPYSPEFQQYHHLHRHHPGALQHHHLHHQLHQQQQPQQQPQQQQGSVIHPPVITLNGGDAATRSDVILNVHNLDHLATSSGVVTDYLPVQANSRPSQIPTHMNGGQHQWSTTSAPDYFSMTSTAIASQQPQSMDTSTVASTSRSIANGHQHQQPPQQSPNVVTSTPIATPNPNYTPYVLPPLHHAPAASSSASSSYGDVNVHRKRPRTDSVTTPNVTAAAIVKPEPNSPTGDRGDRTSEEDSLYYDDSFGGQQQTIRFSEFQKEQWFTLYNMNGREMPPLGFAVVADKGFNYSHFDTTFVNQKKNHFQVSVHIEVRDPLSPKFVRIPNENGGTLKPISEFQLDFFGVKAELLSSYISIKQSQTDRKPITYEPVKLDLPPNRVTKVTVARLHFSETTMNNQRKNGRPNPDQKYFYLVASLNAVVNGNEKYTIAAYNSERVIVRASNPGQFDNGDTEVHWQKAQTHGSIFHPGPVGIGTDKPSTALSVTGDITCTGTVYHPSDGRLKQNIQELNCAEALSKLSQLRVVQYEIRPEIADQWGLSMEERQRVGVIAQELEDIIPDAVKENGDYLTVDDNRIFYESAAAVKELCRLTGNLEYKIEEVEKISKKLSRLSYLKRLGSLRSTSSVNTCSSSKPPESVCNGSYFSCSQNSIDGTPQAKRRNEKSPAGEDEKFDGENRSKHRHHHHHHHHHCACRRLSFADRRGPCSNKVIQSSVIILVIVMAFCLLSMATLYVLDWHKRNTAPALVSTNLPSGAGGHQPSGQTGGGKPAVGLMATAGKQPTAYNPFVLHPPPYKQPKPLHSCSQLPCMEFCCPNSYNVYYPINEENGNSDSSSDGGTIVVTVEQRHDPSTWNLPPVGTKFQDKLLNMVNTKLKQFRQKHNSTVEVQHSANNGGSSSNRIEKRRAKADYAYSPPIHHSLLSIDHHHQPQMITWRAFDAPNPIKIVSLNESIDARYCLENTCSDPKRANFTFYVPVSKYMPHIPLDLQFGIDSKQLVQYCAKWTGEFCSGVEEAYKEDKPEAANGIASAQASSATSDKPKRDQTSEVQQKLRDTWELLVGTYQTSTYRFRVGTSTMLCSLPDDEAGAMFVEYNVHFFRTCL